MMGGGGGEYWVAKMGSLPEILTYNKLAYTDAISPVNIIQPKLQWVIDSNGINKWAMIQHPTYMDRGCCNLVTPLISRRHYK